MAKLKKYMESSSYDSFIASGWGKWKSVVVMWESGGT